MAIQVTYRRTRRLSMRIVKNGDVHVSAPIGMPKKEVERFIEEHRDWITEARKKTYESQKRRADFYNQLPLKTREQADDALQRLKALIEPMVERHSNELCHLLEPSHNARFHALMDKFFPRWKDARKETRQICKMEEDESDSEY